MRPLYLAAFACLAAQANSALVSVTDGTTISVSACEPYSNILSSHNATTTEILTETTGSAPDETSSEDAADTGGAMSRPAERSIAGLIGFFVVSLVVL